MSEENDASRSPQEINEDRRVLAFSLGGEEYAIHLLKVREVIAMTETTPIPHAPLHFKGFLNLRGQIISIIDLRTKFKMPAAPKSAESTIIILDLGQLFLGVIVDNVNSVMAIAREDVSAAEMGGMANSDYIDGIARIEGRLIIILNIEKALSSEDLSALRRTAPQATGKAA